MSPGKAAFSWSTTADGRVLVSWHGRQVRVVTGERARRLRERLSLADPDLQQLLLAKITGNFKRGTERR